MEALPDNLPLDALGDDVFSSANSFAIDPALAQLEHAVDDPLSLMPHEQPFDMHHHPHQLHHPDSSQLGPYFNPQYGYGHLEPYPPLPNPYDDSDPLTFSGYDIPMDPSLNADVPISNYITHPRPESRPVSPPMASAPIAPDGATIHSPDVFPSDLSLTRTKKESVKPDRSKKAIATSRGPRGPYKKRPKMLITPDAECSFCDGTNEKNREGMPEEMVSCFSCGRSGHPSCLHMQTAKLIRAVRSYAWKCIECKICELCEAKGDDTRLLFCDYCDRGYHIDCLDPPLMKPPKGSWACPQCKHVKSGRMSTGSSSSIPPASSSIHLKPPSSNSYDSRVGAKGKESASISLRMRKRTSDAEEVESENDGKSRDPFGGVLRGADADTSRSKLEDDDFARFEASWLASQIETASDAADPHISSPSTPRYDSPVPSTSLLANLPRSSRDRVSTLQTATDSLAISRLVSPGTPNTYGSSVSSSLHHVDLDGGSVLQRIKCIRFGHFDIDTWYTAPYPEEYSLVADGRLWLCEFCLKYMKSSFGAERHKLKCKARHPPGDEVYREGAVSVFEVDGRKNKIYCQNLCLLAKMFLDHKTLYYDVEPFLFYVMTETDENGARFVGYFSKEKRSPMEYNVSCILTLPVRQRRGWGNLLIDFSYLLSKKEARVGSPEKPLSNLGLLSYTKYWTTAVFHFLLTAHAPVTIEEISASTSMTPEDIITVLSAYGMINITKSSSPSISHAEPAQQTATTGTLARRNLVHASSGVEVSTTTGGPSGDVTLKLVKALAIPKEYDIQWDPAVVEEHVVRFEAKGWLKINPVKLSWSPFLLEAPRTSLAFLSRDVAGGVTMADPLPTTIEISRTARKVTSHGGTGDARHPPEVEVVISAHTQASTGLDQAPTTVHNAITEV